MKIIRGIKIGGLQQKIFNLMLIIILALIGVYGAVSIYQRNNLTSVVQDANDRQQIAIEEVSEATMMAVLESSMARTTALQAYIANDLFSDVGTDVKTLQAFATELFAHEADFAPHPYYEPDASKAGIPTVQMQHEEGVDPAASRDLGLVANMSEIMLSMYQNSDKLNSCFVATTDGCILFVDDRSDVYIQEDGSVATAPTVQTRPWYRQAVEAGDLIFTGVETDSFSGILGLVCAAPVYRDGELVAVVGADVFLTAIDEYVQSRSSENGYLCVINDDGEVLFSPRESGVFKPALSSKAADLRESDNTELADFVRLALRERTPLTLIEIDGKYCYLTGAPMEALGWTLLSVVEKEVTDQPTAAMLSRYADINRDATALYQKGAKHSETMVLVLTAAVVLLAIMSALALAKKVVKPLEHMTRRINALSGSDQAFEMEEVYRTDDEIEILAESFASLSRKTRDYISQITRITAEKERIGTELALATRIQADMLPGIFPAFPDRKEFDIYASMDPAKEVGGDFYDFFLIDQDHLCMVIADVSGKGIPAALFMMASKIILANNAMLGKSPARILSDTNAAICSNNREEMFVTTWLGILEISTGKLTAANAGHEYPALQRPDGSFELFRDKHGLVIGAFDGVRYKEYEMHLEPGSRLFLYTDGVTEAMNTEGDLFGTERMLDALNRQGRAHPEQILRQVTEEINSYIGGAEQFDDLTMLCLEYKGKGGNEHDD